MYFNVYPRYYVTGLSYGETDVKSDGDAEVVNLYSMYMNRLAPSDTWSFQERVLRAALRLFGESFTTWLDYQRKNPKMVGYNLGYINDTLRFIEGHSRQLTQSSWMELFSELNDGSPLPTQEPVSHLRSFTAEETAKVIQTWCGRPHGFDDLVCTLNAFFGSRMHSVK